ncbi:1700069L16Rik [Phodopus roborovskii]|uniref:1700069L16Rik protein n=1 Tax=Phodopus roborovskii TaxID=109678 RepID=A0AAU9ZSP7_PHORO|nr:1700069L16Rik [Phodopus roborovskii]
MHTWAHANSSLIGLKTAQQDGHHTWYEVSLHPSSKKLLFATDRDHYRKTQQINTQKCRAQSPVDTSTKHSRT